MKMSEIINAESHLSEAGLSGLMQQGLQGLKSLVPGSIGARAKGALATSGTVNQLIKSFQTWLGQAGLGSPTKENFVQWLQIQNLPIDKVDSLLGSPAIPTPVQAKPASPITPIGATVAEATLSEDTPITNTQISKVLTALTQQHFAGTAQQSTNAAPTQVQPKVASQTAVHQTAPSMPVAATTPAPSAGPQAGQEIEMPGTNQKFKYTPNWLDAGGKAAPAAVATVLAQLASGVTPDKISGSDLSAARRSIGLPENTVNKKLAVVEFHSKFLNQKI